MRILLHIGNLHEEVNAPYALSYFQINQPYMDDVNEYHSSYPYAQKILGL